MPYDYYFKPTKAIQTKAGRERTGGNGVMIGTGSIAGGDF